MYNIYVSVENGCEVETNRENFSLYQKLLEIPFFKCSNFIYIGFSVSTEFSGRGFKFHSDKLSIGTSINAPVVGEYHLHQFIPLNSCDCFRPEYKMNFRPGIRQKFFLKEMRT